MCKTIQRVKLKSKLLDRLPGSWWGFRLVSEKRRAPYTEHLHFWAAPRCLSTRWNCADFTIRHWLATWGERERENTGTNSCHTRRKSTQGREVHANEFKLTVTKPPVWFSSLANLQSRRLRTRAWQKRWARASYSCIIWGHLYEREREGERKK